jgi:uncharacterized protein (DUF433 family)
LVGHPQRIATGKSTKQDWPTKPKDLKHLELIIIDHPWYFGQINPEKKSITCIVTENISSRITINPEICNGKPTIRGMRITVKTVLDFLASGETIENLLHAYPFLEREDILACLNYASLVIDKDKSVFKLSN